MLLNTCGINRCIFLSVKNLQFYKPGSVALESGDLFSQNFDQHEEVGKGRFGVVYRVSEKPSGRRRAAKLIKCIRKEERDKVIVKFNFFSAIYKGDFLKIWDHPAHTYHRLYSCSKNPNASLIIKIEQIIWDLYFQKQLI